ncbi:MAG TPA: uroporphyrinogen-III synthase, partial [Candidatus Dormibacteraeota bacterium]
AMTGALVWFPAAEGAGAALPEGLRAAGAEVRTQAVYRSVMPPDAPRRLAAALDTGVDAVTLTSGSTARHLVRALAGRALPDGAVVVCIGPHTADVARRCGIGVTGVADEPSARGLVTALDRAWSGAARA